MENPGRSKGNKILKCLKKPSSFSISVAPFSPRHHRRQEKSSKPKKLPNRAFSGPLLYNVQAEVRRRQKSRRLDTPEPRSPKVSCIGQIKHKKANRSRRKPSSSSVQEVTARRPSFAIRRMFQCRMRPDRPSTEARKAEGCVKVAPALGQMRKFASRHDALAGFDWKKAVEEDEEEEVIVAHSAPIVMGGGAVAVEPKKEVNLWKRRTVDPPSTLQLE